MKTRMKVLIIGATGYIAQQFVDAFRVIYDLRLLDVKTTDRAGEEVEGVETVDLLNAEMDDLLPYFEGVDAVVHSAYVRPTSGTTNPRDVYPVERSNVDMAYKVYQLALESGVKRVVAISTNQAAKWYEQPYYAGLKDRVTPYEYPKPDRFYGWAKAAYESLGFLYASGSLGRKLETVLIRIVAPRDIDAARFRDEPAHVYVRNLAGYISPRDLTQLVQKSIETPDIEDEYGVPFHIFYGVSNNARKFWSIVNARKVIGYAPQDDSEVRFRRDIAELLSD